MKKMTGREHFIAASEPEQREKIPIAKEGTYLYHSDLSISPRISLKTYLQAILVLNEIGTD